MSGRAARISSAVHSGFAASGRLAFFRICTLLSLVGTPQTDDPNAVASWRDDGGVQQAVDVAQHPQPLLAVGSSTVLDAHCGVDVEVAEALEADPSLSDVPGALGASSNSSNTII